MKNRNDYSAEAAIENLTKYPDRFNKPEAFQDLVRGLSVETPGNVTLLYSGMLNPDVSSNNLALALARQDQDLRLIDKTEAAKFLASDECINAVANIHGTTPKKVREDYSDPGNKFLFDGKDGLWASTSQRFVQYTQTEIVTATPYARGDRVFAQVELRETLKNKSIPSINGIPIEVFKDIYKATGSLEEVNKAVAASSYDRMQGMQVAVMNARVTAVDRGAFIDRPSPSLADSDRANLKPLLDPAKAIEFADWRKVMVDARIKLKPLERKDNAGVAGPQINADGKITILVGKVTYNLSNAEKPSKTGITKSFEGTVLHVDKKHVYQSQEAERGKASVIRHDLALYKNPPSPGSTTKVDYVRGTGQVIGREQDLQR